MMTGLLRHEETLTCPYNRSHQILKSKMTVHLVRCRRSNLNALVDICPFNSSHHVKREDYDEHLRMCKVWIYLSMDGVYNFYSGPQVDGILTIPVESAQAQEARDC